MESRANGDPIKLARNNYGDHCGIHRQLDQYQCSCGYLPDKRYFIIPDAIAKMAAMHKNSRGNPGELRIRGRKHPRFLESLVSRSADLRIRNGILPTGMLQGVLSSFWTKADIIANGGWDGAIYFCHGEIGYKSL
jgi:hypothetical protein